MINKISFFVFVSIASVLAFKIGQWRMWRPEKFPETVFITDTLDYGIPDYVSQPSLSFRLFHKSITPRSIQPVFYRPYMDSVYTAVSVVTEKKQMKVIGKKDKIAHKFSYDDVPANFELYGTETGFNVIRHRFQNPFSWKGLLIGFEFYDLYREINPYVETGIKIKNIDVSIGIDKNSLKEKIPVYADVSYKIL